MKKKSKKNFLNNQNGYALIFVSLLTVVILFILCVAYMSLISSESRFVSMSYQSNTAINLAEAGVEKAIWEVNYGGDTWTGWALDGTDRVFTDTSFQGSNGTSMGDFTVRVVNPSGTNPIIEATGYVPSKAAAGAQRTVRVVLGSASVFVNGIYGGNEVKMSGGVYCDSYNSLDDPYNPSDHGTEGNVASSGNINISGGSYIYGNAIPGPSCSVSDPSSVLGSTTPATSTTTLPPVDLADYASNNDNILIGPTDKGKSPFSGGPADVKLSGGDNLFLPNGTFYFTSVKVSGGSTITLDSNPDVTIYCTGDFSISGGGVVNTLQQPSGLIIYSTGNSFKLSGGADFYGGLYAPNADAQISGGTDFFGALIVGGQAKISGGSDVHFDKALKDLAVAGSSSLVPESWQEKY